MYVTKNGVTHLIEDGAWPFWRDEGWSVDADADSVPDSQGGPATATVRKLDFAFDTPGLDESPGVEVFTPVVGEILLGWAIAVDTPFDCDTEDHVAALTMGQFAADRALFGSGVTRAIYWVDESGVVDETPDGLLQGAFYPVAGSGGSWPIIQHADPVSVILDRVDSGVGDPEGVSPGSTIGAGTVYVATLVPTPV